MNAAMRLSLASLAKPSLGAVICTLVGEGGIGKTSLAATFPAPVFIRSEDGLTSLIGQDVQAFPLAESSTDVLEALQVLLNEEHEFKTVVIDSITQLNIMFEKEIIDSDPKASSIIHAMGGYGAGYAALASKHGQVRELCNQLAHSKGMNVVFIAHAENETVEPPDNNSYTRYSLRLHKKSVAHYVDNADLVAFIKQKTLTTGDGDVKKARTTGERIITCYPTPNHVSKNRFGIKEDLLFVEGENPFVPYIQALVGA